MKDFINYFMGNIFIWLLLLSKVTHHSNWIMSRRYFKFVLLKIGKGFLFWLKCEHFSIVTSDLESGS